MNLIINMILHADHHCPFFYHRAAMQDMKKERIVLIAMVIVMKNNSMVGMELCRDSFKGLSIKCNMAGLCK